jgi:putative oxidoreductase
MFQKLIATDGSKSALVARLALGIVIFPHGAQKLLGWFGGGGVSGTLDFFANAFGIPAFLAFLVILAEFFGSLGLIVGFVTRFCAFSVGLVMAGAMFMVHLPNGFFMNWSGQQAGEGYEYHLLAIGLVLALMISGGGAASVDRALARK